jgi:hypothetical protein
MNNFRQKLLDTVIAKYGFEHPITINFAHLCEKGIISPKVLSNLATALIELQEEEKDEETTLPTKGWLVVFHYVAVIAFGMFIGGLLSIGYTPDFVWGLALSSILAIATKIAIKESV